MKYRDLIFVICLVALGALGWSTLAADSPEALSSPQAVKSPSPGVAPVSDTPRQLQLKVEGQAKTLEELVVEVTILPQADLTVPLNKDGVPVADLFLSLDDKTWAFTMPDRAPVFRAEVDKLDGFAWKIAVADLTAPSDIDALRAVFGTTRLQISTMFDEIESDGENDMFRRRVVGVVSGTTTLEPLSSSEL